MVVINKIGTQQNEAVAQGWTNIGPAPCVSRGRYE